MTGWLAPPALLALALALGGSARADVCVAVNPVLEIGCRESGGAPTGGEPTQSSEPAGAPQSEEVTRSSTEPRYDPRRLAITFRPGTSQATVRAVIDRAGTTLEEAIPKIHAYLVGVEPERRAEALRSFRSSSSVASAAQDLIAEALDTNPDDSDWPQQDGLRVVGFPKAWDVTRGSSRVVVAVIDSGVDARQPDLRGALVPGYDFVNSDTDPSDDHGHGTAVAGVIAARADNHEGGAGICSRCSVMPIKVLDATGSGNDTVIAAAIVWATDHGARVINLSLGGPGASQELEQRDRLRSRQGRDRRGGRRQQRHHDAVLSRSRLARAQRCRDHRCRPPLPVVELRSLGACRGSRLQHRARSFRWLRDVLRDVIGDAASRRPHRARVERGADGDRAGRRAGAPARGPSAAGCRPVRTHRCRSNAFSAPAERRDGGLPWNRRRIDTCAHLPLRGR